MNNASRQHKSNPRVTIRDRDGRSTLSGLNYQDLRSILTAAALYNYSEMEKHKKSVEPHEHNCTECQGWRKQQLRLIKITEESLDEAIRDTFPKSSYIPSLQERRKKVEQERSNRLFIDNLTAMIVGT